MFTIKYILLILIKEFVWKAEEVGNKYTIERNLRNVVMMSKHSMGYTRVCTPILYLAKSFERYQYPIPILYQIPILNPSLVQRNLFPLTRRWGLASMSLQAWTGHSSLSINVWLVGCMESGVNSQSFVAPLFDNHYNW